jgi:hypothetical protein
VFHADADVDAHEAAVLTSLHSKDVLMRTWFARDGRKWTQLRSERPVGRCPLTPNRPLTRYSGSSSGRLAQWESTALTTQSGRVRDQDSFTSSLVSAYFLDVRDTRRYPVTLI